MPPFIQSFLSQASARGARSTALHPVQWALGLLLGAVVTAAGVHAAAWIQVALLCSVAVMVVLFTGAYIFLLIRNPDALRSEQFTLSKLAIERGLIGDSMTGLHEDAGEDQRALQARVVTSEGGER